MFRVYPYSSIGYKNISKDGEPGQSSQDGGLVCSVEMSKSLLFLKCLPGSVEIKNKIRFIWNLYFRRSVYFWIVWVVSRLDSQSSAYSSSTGTPFWRLDNWSLIPSPARMNVSYHTVPTSNVKPLTHVCFLNPTFLPVSPWNTYVDRLIIICRWWFNNSVDFFFWGGVDTPGKKTTLPRKHILMCTIYVCETTLKWRRTIL